MAQRTKERQEERRKQQQRRNILYIVGAIVVAIVIIGALVIVSNAPADAPIPSDTATRYEGIPASIDDNNYPLLGKPNAKVQVIAYLSFTSVDSLAFYKNVFPSLLERVKKGEISLAIAPIKNASGNNPDGAARTALCAGEQGKFWQAHDTLFLWAEQFGNGAFSTNRIRQGMDKLGVKGDAFNACFGSGRIADILTKAQQGIGTTPTVKVNGAIVGATLAELNTSIDSFGPFTPAAEATSEATAEMSAEATAETTAEATAETTTEATTVKPTATATQVKPSATPTEVPATATATQVKPSATPTTEATAEATASS